MQTKEYQSKVGKLILSFLQTQKDKAVSVNDIASFLEQNNVKTNITTIYRRLEKLVDEKKVITHSSEDCKKALFQYVADDEDCMHHLHIQCSNCSKIIHLDSKEADDFVKSIAKKNGIEIDFSKTILYGLCDDCRKNKK